MTKPTKPNNDWEKEFDKNFPQLSVLTGKIGSGREVLYDFKPFVKDFISKTLQQQREEIIKEIEGIVGEDEFIDRTSDITKLPDGDYMDNPELDRRNQLRKEIKERLKQI